MARQVLPVVGAAVGAWFGGAKGAQWGWMIGSLVGNIVDPQVIKGPSLGDFAQQTSQEGMPRAIVFGLSPPLGGNVCATSTPKVVKKKQRQGKGGPVTETENVYRTYGISVCEGPITGFLRVWRNGVLVYDARPDADASMAAQNTEFLKTARFFLGGYNQMPSPDLETVYGVGNTPAMRGTAYMVMANEDLTDMRGAIPQYAFQVMRCEGSYLTSRPYAIESTDSGESSVLPTSGWLHPQPFPLDSGASSLAMTGGSLFTTLFPYSAPVESGSSVVTMQSGSLYETLYPYDAGFDSGQAGISMLSGAMFSTLVPYTIPAESGASQLSMLGGTLA